jgi:isocitrate dehydrogenase (NAD+)
MSTQTTHQVTLLPGDGIGPEVTEAAVRVIDAAGVKIEWDRVEAGGEVIAKYGTAVPEPVLQSIRRNGVALKGPITTPVGEGFRSVDLIVVRENTEDLYSGLEHRVTVGVVESIKVVTERACLRIARYAFALARRLGRDKVTAVHKANIMKLTDGLFLECCRRVAREHRDIAFGDVIVDNCAMQLVRDPSQFDVLLLGNLYGDIMSDLCAGLVGGLGVVPGANVGDDVAVFEAVHGSAPDIAGKGLANPTAVILSSVEMLKHLGEMSAANRIETAVQTTLMEPLLRTHDLGGKATTDAFTKSVIERLG